MEKGGHGNLHLDQECTRSSLPRPGLFAIKFLSQTVFCVTCVDRNRMRDAGPLIKRGTVRGVLTVLRPWWW